MKYVLLLFAGLFPLWVFHGGDGSSAVFVKINIFVLLLITSLAWIVNRHLAVKSTRRMVFRSLKVALLVLAIYGVLNVFLNIILTLNMAQAVRGF